MTLADVPQARIMSTVTDVLAACQRGVSVHRKLLTSLKTIHDSYGSESKFFADFLPPLHHSLVCEENSPAVERTLEFVARFAHHLCPSAADPDDPDATAEEPEQVHPFFHNLFDFLLTSHDAGSQAVRLRCCQLLNKLLLHLGANAYLEDELYERLHQAMLERLQDVAPSVRVQAVFALSRLQEPKNKQCPVIRAYQFHMQNDPSADVRRAVLLNIAGSALTLPSVLERIRDVSAAVRRRAFLYLTKVSAMVAELPSAKTQGLGRGIALPHEGERCGSIAAIRQEPGPRHIYRCVTCDFLEQVFYRRAS